MCVRNSKCILGILTAVMMLCSLSGCTRREDAGQSAEEQETSHVQSTEVRETDVQSTDEQSIAQGNSQGAQSGEDLDTVEPETDDDDWYKKKNVYTNEEGRSLEVYFDDGGMLEFAVDGLSMYYTTVDNFQQENNWKIYTCDTYDDGIVVIVYYPGNPAHLEISDGDYAGLYEESSGKVKEADL